LLSPEVDNCRKLIKNSECKEDLTRSIVSKILYIFRYIFS